MTDDILSRAPRLDVHHHMVPPAYLAAVEGPMRATANIPGDAFAWSPEKSLAQLDATGFDAAVLSLSAPGVWFGDRAEAIRLARLCNDYGAEIVARHPRRFGFYATLPLPDIDASLTELAHAFDTLRADGVGLLTSYDSIWLGSPALEPLMAELDRRAAVVFVHPTVPKASLGLVPGLPDPILEFLFDATRTLTSMLFAGTLTKFPRIRFIFTHSGAATPSVAHRITQGLRLMGKTAESANVAAALAAMHFDTANSGVELNVGALRRIAPDDRILFGSDYPYVPMAVTVEQLAGSSLGAPAADSWRGGNGAALFPRFF